MASGDGQGAVERSQDVSHGENFDYTVGSPHLRHTELRECLNDRITGVVREIIERQGTCAVLEIGAGHGSFTDIVLAAGGTVTVTEMSKASYEYLSKKFRNKSEVRVIYDTDGSAPFQERTKYDVLLLISVIHHIPEYLQVVASLCDEVLQPGGSVVTFQDPLWYPRQTRWERALSAGAYLLWRTTQGELRRGVATRIRRMRGVYSETEPSDLVEYHVVRQGVDDRVLEQLLGERFREIETDRYFSTQSPQLQSILGDVAPPNTFGITARDYFK